MDRFEKGMLVRSKAGHDAGEIFIITGTEDANVQVADGSRRTVKTPKKKKKKHVQIILQQYDIQDADDVKIRRIIKEWNKKEENQEDQRCQKLT